MRHTRKQPFCWQEKKVLRLLKTHCKKQSELVKLRNLYLTLTEIESDFNGKDIKYYTKTIAKYSGLSPDYIPTGLKIFQLLGVIQVVEDRINGRFKGKRVVFTPDNIPENTVPDKPMNGKSVNGNQGTSEDSSFKEDSNLEEDKEHCAKKNSHANALENLFPNNPVKNLPASSVLKPSNAERRQRESGAGNYSTEFEEWWRHWVDMKRNIAKPACFKKWGRISISNQRQLIVAIQTQKQWYIESGFIPLPMTYLNQGRWYDTKEAILFNSKSKKECYVP